MSNNTYILLNPNALKLIRLKYNKNGGNTEDRLRAEAFALKHMALIEQAYEGGANMTPDQLLNTYFVIPGFESTTKEIIDGVEVITSAYDGLKNRPVIRYRTEVGVWCLDIEDPSINDLKTIKNRDANTSKK